MRSILASALIVMVAVGSPAFAQGKQNAAKPRRASTVVKWTLIGAAAGFGTGFMLGFRAYDDATFAEQKIMRSGLIGAAIGGVGGALLGRQRARASDSRAPQLKDESRRLKKIIAEQSLDIQTLQGRRRRKTAQPAASPKRQRPRLEAQLP